MSLIGRLFVIAFAFCMACFIAGAIVVVAILFPEVSSIDVAGIDPNALNVILGFGFIFVSGFAL
ncbi:MAG: putative rane protein of unknown function, partial [Tardiphaga sp.]|nr:putative rane protein of unknown function [Tardiphaga sp.]